MKQFNLIWLRSQKVHLFTLMFVVTGSEKKKQHVTVLDSEQMVNNYFF